MKKTTLITAIIMLTGTAIAAQAVISPSSPSDIVLKPSNNYQVAKQFDGSASTPDDVSYSWTWVETSQTDTGPTTNFTFDRDDPQTNTIKLVVSNSTSSDDDSVTQTLKDKPNLTVTANTTSIDLANSNGYVKFKSTVNNTFDRPSGAKVNYNWTYNGKEKSTSSSFTMQFNSTGDKKVKLNASDTAGYSGTGSVTVSVTNSNNNNNNNNNNNGGGSGGGGAGGGGAAGIGAAAPPNKPKGLKIAAKVSNGRAKAEVGSVKAKQEIQITLPPQANSAVQGVSLTPSNAAANVSATVEEIGKSFNKLKGKVSQKPSGKVYSYQEINVSGVKDSEIENASVNFTVSKSFIQQNSLNAQDVRLKRYTGNSWESYQAEKIGSTESAHRFKSEVPGFSYYAIAFEDSETSQQQKEDQGTGQEQDTTNQESSNQEEQKDKSDSKSKESTFPVLPLAAITVLVVAILATAFYLQEKESNADGSDLVE